jgi:D-galactarolactone isomerase
MKTFGADARGIVVPDQSISEFELQELSEAGVCGVRFHMLPGGALEWDVLETVATRVHNFGWHVQLQMNGREFPEREELLKRLPCDLVVDHVGRFMGPVPVSDEAFKTLLGFLESGRCWVKLSAPYESSESGPPDWEDVSAEARELIRFAPERMLWASNWPHPGQTDPPDEADLLDLLLHWADDAAIRTKILRDNPAELYRF